MSTVIHGSCRRCQRESNLVVDGCFCSQACKDAYPSLSRIARFGWLVLILGIVVLSYAEAVYMDKPGGQKRERELRLEDVRQAKTVYENLVKAEEMIHSMVLMASNRLEYLNKTVPLAPPTNLEAVSP